MAKNTHKKLPPGSPGEIIPELPAVAIGPQEWGTSVVSIGFGLDLDPAILVDRMTRAVLQHTRDSILAGVRPDTGGPQKEISARAAAVPGRQSDHRGYRTGALADGIRRSKIARDGATASSRIVPPPNRNVYVAEEKKRGVNLLTLAGKSGAAAREGAREAMAEIVQGGKVPVNDREVEADDVK